MVCPWGQCALARMGPPGRSLIAPNQGCDPAGVMGDIAVPHGCCVWGPRGAPTMLTPSLPCWRRHPCLPPAPRCRAAAAVLGNCAANMLHK